MAEFMNQNDVHQLSSFIHDCFLTRVLGVDPALLLPNLILVSLVPVACFMSCGSVTGSLPTVTVTVSTHQETFSLCINSEGEKEQTVTAWEQMIRVEKNRVEKDRVAVCLPASDVDDDCPPFLHQ
jgi:hypothetical protein